MAVRHVRLKAKKGRIARVSARGEMIPHDRFINVQMTPYVQRLINKWGDVEVEPQNKRSKSQGYQTHPGAPEETAKKEK